MTDRRVSRPPKRRLGAVAISEMPSFHQRCSGRTSLMASVRNVNDKIQQSLENGDAADVAAQLAQLREDLANLAESVKALGVGASHELKAQAARVADDAISASSDMADTVRNEISTLNDNLTDQVQKNPLQSLGIAIGVGFVLALLTRR
ncbi:DUF883 domain-containing protein [Agrobacterium fabrum]|uniref:DUF883 domain-containing protein n=2 Tax=Agrobacterium fabrum TaxID=1176649 RepID=Q7CU84_AGRFC|nr:conserved hypothetical protein [Agrobacterium fabrum str. C58]QRM61750.1 DUF883 domain-containing protein [Agrobacterium fabrum]TRB24366.1 DUF883 domain-containing protein [Agrobacterium fabrum]